jgi:hypothetical protein
VIVTHAPVFEAVGRSRSAAHLKDMARYSASESNALPKKQHHRQRAILFEKTHCGDISTAELLNVVFCANESSSFV